MTSKQQIMPSNLAVSCETYGCYKKVAWAIGRPDGPRELWHYHCDQCARDIVENIPAELLPPAPVFDVPAALELIKQELTTETDACVPMIEELMDILTEKGFLEAEVIADDEPDGNLPTCQYCGKECKNQAGLQAHQRTCKEREVKPDE